MISAVVYMPLREFHLRLRRSPALASHQLRRLGDCAHFSGCVTHTGPLFLWFFEQIVPVATLDSTEADGYQEYPEREERDTFYGSGLWENAFPYTK